MAANSESQKCPVCGSPTAEGARGRWCPKCQRPTIMYELQPAPGAPPRIKLGPLKRKATSGYACWAEGCGAEHVAEYTRDDLAATPADYGAELSAGFDAIFPWIPEACDKGGVDLSLADKIRTLGRQADHFKQMWEASEHRNRTLGQISRDEHPGRLMQEVWTRKHRVVCSK